MQDVFISLGYRPIENAFVDNTKAWLFHHSRTNAQNIYHEPRQDIKLEGAPAVYGSIFDFEDLNQNNTIVSGESMRHSAPDFI
jgi:hypothetical protein